MTPWPPEGFKYGARMLNGAMEHHPILPPEKRTREILQAALLDAKKLQVPDTIRHVVCGKRTLMGFGIAETLFLAKTPFKPYGRLFCAQCKNYFDLTQFIYAETNEQVAK